MKLPNAERAVVEERKPQDYLLSDSHPIGRFKAAFFAELGFGAKSWKELQLRLTEFALSEQATIVEESAYGRKYLISGTLKGPSGTSAEVVTIWILLHGDDTPRLVTVYPR